MKTFVSCLKFQRIGYNYVACMDYMDLDVRCSQKARFSMKFIPEGAIDNNPALF